MKKLRTRINLAVALSLILGLLLGYLLFNKPSQVWAGMDCTLNNLTNKILCLPK